MPTSKRYYLFHKPFKVLSQFSNEAGNRGIGSVLKLPKDVYPVGRLDLDSEGLLLLTNDRKLTDQLLNPKHAHARTYWVEVEGEPNAESLKQLTSGGVEINLGKGRKHKTLPCNVRLLPEVHVEERSPPVNKVKHPVRTWLAITLREGKNRQVRKMTAKIGHPTLRLLRVSIENIHLDNLKPGELKQISKNVLYKKLNLT